MGWFSSLVDGAKKLGNKFIGTCHEVKEKARDLCDRVSTRLEEWKDKAKQKYEEVKVKVKDKSANSKFDGNIQVMYLHHQIKKPQEGLKSILILDLEMV